MKMALKELRYYAKRYLLIELLIMLMMFMVVFLIGLASGLGRVVSAGIEEIDAPYFMVSKDSEGIITSSILDETILEQVSKKVKGDNYTTLTIQRSALTDKDDQKIDAVYFAIKQDSFIAPEISEGKGLSSNPYDLVLNDRFKDEGIAIGDSLEDKATGSVFTVVGFAPNAYYGHSSIAYVSQETLELLNQKANERYTFAPQTIIFQSEDAAELVIDNTEVLDKRRLITKIPAYSAQQLTLNLIIWILVAISSAILGVFFYIITLQKRREFGVMKAIGMSMAEIVRVQLSQVFLLASSGLLLGLLLAFGLSWVLPKTLPFYLTLPAIVPATLAFLFIAVLSSILSIRQVSKIDPIEVINGGEV